MPEDPAPESSVCPESYDPLHRLPHTGPARLPDRVIHLEPSVRVVAERSLAAGDSCLNDRGVMPAMLLVELMAQVGGLLLDPAGIGPHDYAVLAGIRRLHLHATAAAGDTVQVDCDLIRRLGDLHMIGCRASAGGRRLAHGTIQIRQVRRGAS